MCDRNTNYFIIAKQRLRCCKYFDVLAPMLRKKKALSATQQNALVPPNPSESELDVSPNDRSSDTIESRKRKALDDPVSVGTGIAHDLVRKCCVSRCNRGGILQECQSCKTHIHAQCYQRLKLKPDHKDADGNAIVFCTKNCYQGHTTLQRNRSCRQWHNDGKQGTMDPVSSEAILVEWLAAGNNYVELCSHPKDGTRQRNTCATIAKRINDTVVNPIFF